MFDTNHLGNANRCSAPLAGGLDASSRSSCWWLPLMGCVAYLTLWERKGIGWTQVAGPNRVGPRRAAAAHRRCRQADLQGDHPSRPRANKGCSSGPVLSDHHAGAGRLGGAPFGPEVAVANVNAGLLFLMAITSLEVYGVIIAGWASNSKYAFLGALRASAQMVSYEIAMGFALVVVLMVSAWQNLNRRRRAGRASSPQTWA